MTLFGEFLVPSDAFALNRTLQSVPDAVIDIERVVASRELLTPYFWVSVTEFDAFEAAVAEDPSVQRLRKLDEFDESALYRAEWTENTEAIAYAYTNVGATILEAKGENDQWELRIRFDSHERLTDFREYCQANEISFELRRLYDISNPQSGVKYGLTQKQHDALVTAWEAGYFETPREATLTEVADELGISAQSLSGRLRRANQTWIANALTIAPPSEDTPVSGIND
ncbi:helix-turn-helix domain-containing protein [Halorarum halobium]|uniref:helix-turn-helix domain-containing protein n=1 Tax=Halorarum halobium TaxID=3075121 RepID=UPI0028AF8307|nr:helix-turn-helix domain-containing protein [Halobaculum sp. XH14]